MNLYPVVYDLLARQDLQNQFHYILEQSGAARAADFVDRIETFVLNLAEFPEMGRLLSHKPADIRAIAFRRQAYVLYEFDGSRVLILRIFAKGQDGLSWLNDLLDDPNPE
jgi:plasmid stabilization system protein ParE